MFLLKNNKNKFVVRRADNFACIGCSKCRGCFGCFRCHRCYNCISCSKSSHTSFSKKCNNCHDSIWLISCNSCYFCFYCVSCIYCYHCKVCTHALASTLCVSCNSIYHCRLCNGISDVQMLFCDDWFFLLTYALCYGKHELANSRWIGKRDILPAYAGMILEIICCLARFREGVILTINCYVPGNLAFAPIV